MRLLMPMLPPFAAVDVPAWLANPPSVDLVRRTSFAGAPCAVPPDTAPPLALVDLVAALESHAPTVTQPLSADTYFYRPHGIPARLLVPIAMLVPGRYQPRTEFDQELLDGLAASITESGIRTALKVFANEHGQLELIAGERRMRASTQLQLVYVPVEIDDAITLRDIASLSFIDNLQRENLSPLEEGIALDRLIVDMQVSESEFARSLGKDRTWLRQRLTIARGTTELHTALREQAISFTQARTVVTHAVTPAAQQQAIKALEKAKANNGDTPLTEKQVQEIAEQAALAAGKKDLKKLGWLVVDSGGTYQWQRPIVFAANERPAPWSGADISACVRERRTPRGEVTPTLDPLASDRLIALRRVGHGRVDLTTFAPWVAVSAGYGEAAPTRYLTGEELQALVAAAQASTADVDARAVAAGWTADWENSMSGGRLISPGGRSLWCGNISEMNSKLAAIEAGEITETPKAKAVRLERCADCGASGATNWEHRTNGVIHMCDACAAARAQVRAAATSALHAAAAQVLDPLFAAVAPDVLRLLLLGMTGNGNAEAFGLSRWGDVETTANAVREMNAAALPAAARAVWLKELERTQIRGPVSALLGLAIAEETVAAVHPSDDDDDDGDDEYESLGTLLDVIERSIEGGLVREPAHDLEELRLADSDLAGSDLESWAILQPRLVWACAELEALIKLPERHDLAYVVREAAAVEAIIRDGTYGPTWEHSTEQIERTVVALCSDLEALADVLDDSTYETLVGRLQAALYTVAQDTAMEQARAA